MRYQAVIFDLFGTLVDFRTEAEYREAAAKVARILGAPLNDFRKVWVSTLRDRDRGLFGSLEGDLENAARLLGLQTSVEQIRQAAEVRLKLYHKNLTPRRGAIETLTALRTSGLKTGLIAGCAWEVPDLWHNTLFVPLIDFAVFSCVAGLSKPEPRIYKLACEGLKVPNAPYPYTSYIAAGSPRVAGADYHESP